MLRRKCNQVETSRSSGHLTVIFLGLALFLFGSNCGKPRAPVNAPTTNPPVSTSTNKPDPTEISPVPEIDLRIEPSSINPGESSLLTWETRNALKVTIGPAVGTVDTTGRIRVFPEQTTTYIVEAEGDGGTRSKSVTVDVTSTGVYGGIREDDLSNAPLEERFTSFVKPIFFGFDSTQLSPEAKQILDKNIQWLRLPENESIQFVIEGHADERGSEEYNLALGDSRAEIAADYLRGNGISRIRISTVSLGEERPFDTRKVEAGYAQNRRAHFVLLKIP